MASISNDPNGRRRILFVAADGKRKTIRLGKVSRRVAESVKIRIEDLVAASITGHAPADATSHWVRGLDEDLHAKLAGTGLVKPRGVTTLAGFIDSYIDRRTDVKPSTRLVYQRVRRYLVDYFGEDKPLRDITAGDAEGWRLHLMDQDLADNTVRRACGIAKQWARSAMRHELLDANPFDELVAAVRANTSRFHFVTREESDAVLAACPDAEWRLLFALVRYGGLRCPSEILLLKWSDIDWSGERFTVTSPKTEHHEGHGSRMVPIFPELLPYLREAFEQAEPGAEWCITRYRSSAVNLRTQLLRLIKRAGLSPWPKLWQNLRSTRDTELANDFPAHVASAWIGNSVAVATRHYLQVTEDHFKEAAQNAAQKMQEGAGNEMKPGRASPEQTPETSGNDSEFPVSSFHFDTCELGDAGLEPATSSL